VRAWQTTASWHKTRQLGDPSEPNPFPDRVLALAFHPRGHLLATGCGIPSRSAKLDFWRVSDGSLASTIEKAHDDTITALAFSPDGTRLASSSTDRFVKIHDVASGTLLEQLEGHTNHVLDVAWSADGETIASAGADEVAKLWIAAEGRQKKTEEGFRKEVTSLHFLGLGEDVVLGSGDKIVKSAGQYLPGVQEFIYDVSARADGAVLAAGGDGGTLLVWRAQDRTLLHTFPPAKPATTDPASP
jgi:WD40 repeat protein